MITRDELIQIMGPGRVSSEAQDLEDFSSDMSFVNAVRPEYVVRPGTSREIELLVKLANETLTPLIPVSSGPPHFRGDTVPGTGGGIVVDLSGMKNIIFVDRPRRVAMVEPGVTFAELIPAVKNVGLRLNMPLLPRQSKSVTGSMLEREPVQMPGYQWDNSDPLACAGIFFGTGDEFRTGQSAGPGNLEEQWAVGGVQKAPYGPGIASFHRIIQGAQGTMGIVSWASMRCELLPSIEEPFVSGGSRLSPLLDLSSRLIRLRMVNECFILNRTSLAAIFAAHLPGDFSKLRDSLPAWILFFTLAGYEYFPEERVHAHIRDLTDLIRDMETEVSKAVGGISASRILQTVQQPSPEPYWKLHLEGGSHDIFYLTVNDRIEEQVSVMRGLADTAGYATSETGIYIQPIVQGTGCHCEFTFFYDPGNAVERRRIRELSAASIRRLQDRGAYFSRPYDEHAEQIFNRDAASITLLKKFKKIFDPNNIMNPGKACF
jgi:hypothetical protein